MNEWNIQARSRLCQGCGRTFGNRDGYHTLLFEQRSGLERLDVCGECWESQHRHGGKDRKGFISHWHGTFSEPPPPPPEAIQKGSAEALLRQLLERQDPVWRPATFILAVMLERKRMLRAREQIHQNGGRTFVYEVAKTGEVFMVVDPALQLDQLAQVQHDVARLLEHGLPPETDPTEEPFLAAPTPGSGEEPHAEVASNPGAEAGVVESP